MQRTITFDDLDGESIATETIRFSIGDDFMELDLSSEHADEFTAALAPFVKAARPYSPAKASTTRGQLNAAERQELMTWAADNGIEVSPRGRIASSVVEQWRAVKNAPKPEEEHASVEAINAAIEAGEKLTEETPASDEPTSVTTRGRRQKA